MGTKKLPVETSVANTHFEKQLRTLLNTPQPATVMTTAGIGVSGSVRAFDDFVIVTDGNTQYTIAIPHICYVATHVAAENH